MFNKFIKDTKAQANFLLMVILLICVFTGAYIVYFALFGSGMVADVLQATYLTSQPMTGGDISLLYEKWGGRILIAATGLLFCFVVIIWYATKKDTEERQTINYR